jgi:hypothetical protein
LVKNLRAVVAEHHACERRVLAHDTIISRGFTERQARFLVLVARHSGVCVPMASSRFIATTPLRALDRECDHLSYRYLR